MPPEKAEIYFSKMIVKLRPYIKSELFTLRKKGAAIELSAGIGLLSKEFFAKIFERIELLDIVDHKEAVKKSIKKEKATRKVKFNQCPIESWSPIDKYDIVLGSYTLALMNDEGVEKMLRTAWACLE